MCESWNLSEEISQPEKEASGLVSGKSSSSALIERCSIQCIFESFCSEWLRFGINALSWSSSSSSSLLSTSSHHSTAAVVFLVVVNSGVVLIGADVHFLGVSLASKDLPQHPPPPPPYKRTKTNEHQPQTRNAAKEG